MALKNTKRKKWFLSYKVAASYSVKLNRILIIIFRLISFFFLHDPLFTFCVLAHKLHSHESAFWKIRWHLSVNLHIKRQCDFKTILLLYLKK